MASFLTRTRLVLLKKSTIATSIQPTNISFPNLRKVWSRTKLIFTQHPRLANTIFYGSTGTFGAELFQQTVTRKILSDESVAYDWGSLCRFWVAGYLIFPHVFFYWYRTIDRIFTGTGMKTIIQKTLFDQIVSPAPILILFYTSMSIMERKKDIFEESRVKLETTMKMRYCFMLPAAAINFALIPPSMRVAWQGITTFFWVNILCYLKRLQLEDDVFKIEESEDFCMATPEK